MPSNRSNEPAKLFLYQDLFNRLMKSRDLLPRVLLEAGPGMGKSTVLNTLGHELDDGRTLLVDDLDREFSKLVEKWPTSLRSGSEDPVIATARDSRKLLEHGDKGAGLLRSFQVIELIPVEDPAELERILEEIHRHIKESDPGVEIHDDVLKIWRHAMLDMSGGHPTLLGAANDLLRSLLFFPDSLKGQEKGLLESTPSIEQLRSFLAEKISDKATAIIKPILDAYHQQGNRRLLDQLRTIAAGGDWQGDVSDEKDLLKTGIVHADPSKGLRVGNWLFGEAIRKHEAIRDERATRRVVPREKRSVRVPVVWRLEHTGAEEGLLHLEGIEQEDFSLAIDLNGGSWRLLKRLAAGLDAIVSIEELEADLGLSSEAAVRSTIQRLVKDLKAHEVQDLIENVRGQGYHLPREPHIDYSG